MRQACSPEAIPEVSLVEGWCRAGPALEGGCAVRGEWADPVEEPCALQFASGKAVRWFNLAPPLVGGPARDMRFSHIQEDAQMDQEQLVMLEVRRVAGIRVHDQLCVRNVLLEVE